MCLSHPAAISHCSGLWALLALHWSLELLQKIYGHKKCQILSWIYFFYRNKIPCVIIWWVTGSEQWTAYQYNVLIYCQLACTSGLAETLGELSFSLHISGQCDRILFGSEPLAVDIWNGWHIKNHIRMGWFSEIGIGTSILALKSLATIQSTTTIYLSP